VSATASSGLLVSFASSTPGTCTVSGTTVTIVAAGPCTITAAQAGDGTWSPAPAVSQTVSVAKATVPVTLDCTTGAPFVYSGLPISPCTAAASDTGNPPQPLRVTITYNDAATLPTDAGTYAVVATVDDTRYGGLKTGSVTIGPAPLVVTPNPISLSFGSPVPAYAFTVTGFKNGETPLTAADYVAPTCTSPYTSTTPVSTLTITCSGGSARNYTFTTTATATLTVNKANQAALTITGPSTTTFGVSPFAPTTSGGNGGGAVTFTSSTNGVCTASSSSAVTIVAVGTCTVTAVKAGDASYLPSAPSAPFNITVNRAATAISVTMTHDSTRNPTAQYSDTVTLTATVTPAIAGVVTFTLNGNPSGVPLAARVNGSGVATATLRLDSTVIPLGAGTWPLAASFAPDGGTYATSSTSINVNIQREGQQPGGQPDGSARIDYTGDQFVTVGGANPQLKARLVQSRPPEQGDTELLDDAAVAQVKVNFAVYPAACSTASPAVCPGAVFTAQASLGNDRTVTVAIPSTTRLAEGAYVVVVSAAGNNFVLPMVGTAAFVVSSTGNTYISGGGFVTTDSTSNVDSPRGMFAFNSSKATGTVLGSNVYVYRMRINVTDGGTTATKAGTTCTTIGPTAFTGCRDVDVVIRSTTQTTLNAGQKGYLTGLVTVQYVDAADPAQRYKAFEYSGGAFRLDIIDNSQAGTTSAYGFTAYLANGTTVFHQAYLGGSKPVNQTGIKAVTNTVLIGGGYISSHP